MISGFYYKVRVQTGTGVRHDWDGRHLRHSSGKTWTTYDGALKAARAAIDYDTLQRNVHVDAYNTVGHRIDSEQASKAPKTGLADCSLPRHSFRDKEHKNYHWYLRGAPDTWALERGATHTLMCEDGSRRPLRLLKTMAFVGVDERDGGKIEWERWDIMRDKHLII